MTYRVLVTDGIDRDGVALLEAEAELGVDEVPTLPAPALLERVADYDAVVVRSATRISADVLRQARKLRVVGRAGVGVDNIALDAATELGVAVINAPAGNTLAVAELFFGLVLALVRNIPRAAESMRAGRWERAKLMGSELNGKTLGIVGMGRIGGEVALRAHAFGMSVVGYDPYVTESRYAALRTRAAPTLDALLRESQVLTLHTPLTDESRGLIGERELALLPPGAIVANLARGGLIDDAALLAALQSGRLGGAVIDVFATEPLPGDDPLRSAPNVLLTPHISASTAEAQRNVAVDVCAAVRDALLKGELSRSVNAAWSGSQWGDIRPALLVARRAAAVARALLTDGAAQAVRRVTVQCGRDVAGARDLLLAAAALGTVERVTEADRVNLINARALAEARGIELAVGESAALPPSGVEVSVRGATEELTVAGTAPAGAAPRLTRVGAFHVDVNPRQTLIVLTNRDVPGVIGRVGTLLGAAGVNIAEYHQARLARGGEALAVIAVDGAADSDIRRRLLELPDVKSAAVVSFRDE
ncbi:MAG TPA: phosphoglycerate dehydrogenase [Gemmatimonadaceae bacterium]|nr:phosphoglycerate dehydrogenase [Gemmatimonadaceae bacterium]